MWRTCRRSTNRSARTTTSVCCLRSENEVLKATVAQFDAAELITQREVVSARIREDLLNRAREFNIVLEDVSIVRDISFLT